MASKETDASDSLWVVEEPDEAKYNFSDRKGVWEPKAEDILSMFEQLANGGSLPLKWKCPGRRLPVEDVKEEEAELKMEVDEEEPKEEQEQEPEASAFDFDDNSSDVGAKMSPRRTLGSVVRTPRTEKRVARMDNIMDSLRKQQLQRAAEREARKAKNSPVAGQGRGRLLNFSSPGARNLSPSSGAVKKETPVSSAPRAAIFSTSATAATTTDSAVTTWAETDAAVAAAEKMTNSDGVNTTVSSTSVSSVTSAVVVSPNNSVNLSKSNDKSRSSTSDDVSAAEETASVVQVTAAGQSQDKKDDDNTPAAVHPPPASSSSVPIKTSNPSVITSLSPTPLLQTSVSTSSETPWTATTIASSSTTAASTIVVSESTISSRNSEHSRSPGSAVEAGTVVASEKEAVVSKSKSPRPSRSLTSSPAFSSTKLESSGGLTRRRSGSPISSSIAAESKPLQANTNADSAGVKVEAHQDTDIATEASPKAATTMPTSNTSLSVAQPSVSPAVTSSDVMTSSVSTSSVVTVPLELTETTMQASASYVNSSGKEDDK